MALREWEYFGNAINGHLNVRAQQNISQLLTDLEGKRIRIRISVVRRNRSPQQNRYYWGVIVKAAQIGMTDNWGRDVYAEEAHELLKQQCNGKDLINLQTGEVLRVGQTTTELNKLNAEDYYDRCRKWIFEWFNILVPLPNEQMAIDLQN